MVLGCHEEKLGGGTQVEYPPQTLPCLLVTVCLQPGDKIVQISASFGDDVWDAQNYGQVRYK